jgi:DNA-binding transcriptional LysR family regulator
MTLEQLRIFVAVAEREHVTRAAEALNLTQSTVSAAVSALESRHEVKLFHRVGRRIELTEAGRVFLDEAKAVLARAQAASAVLDELGGLERGSFTVHASQTIASYWLPLRLVAFRAAHPHIAVRLEVGNTAQVARAVNEGSADLGFVEGRVEDPSLVQQVVGSDRLTVVVAPEHPWSAGEPLGARELAQGQWVLREPGSGTRSEFEAALAKLGVTAERLDVVMELPSNEAVRAAVEAGAGATALSELVAQAALSAGTLRRAGVELAERAFLALRHRERYLTKAGDAFLKSVGP